MLVEGGWALLTCTPGRAGPSGGRDRLQLIKLKTPKNGVQRVCIYVYVVENMFTPACMIFAEHAIPFPLTMLRALIINVHFILLALIHIQLMPYSA